MKNHELFTRLTNVYILLKLKSRFVPKFFCCNCSVYDSCLKLTSSDCRVPAESFYHYCVTSKLIFLNFYFRLVLNITHFSQLNQLQLIYHSLSVLSGCVYYYFEPRKNIWDNSYSYGHHNSYSN